MAPRKKGRKVKAKAKAKKGRKMAPTPLPSPTSSIGSAIPPAGASLAEDVLQAARLGPSREQGVLPAGFQNEGSMCYRNAVLTLLMNTRTFTGYLQNFHIPLECAEYQMNLGPDGILDYGSYPGSTYIFADLFALANAYWRNGPVDKAQHISRILDQFWINVQSLSIPRPWNLAKNESGLAEQEDAEEFLMTLFTNFDAQMSTTPDHRRNFVNMFQTSLARRFRCAGNCRNTKIRISTLDDQWCLKVRIPPGRNPGLTLEDCIAFTFNCGEGEALCRECRQAAKEPGSAGRAWDLIHTAPETLFISISRFTWQSWASATPLKKHTAVTIPEVLDITPWLETSVHEAGTQVRYQLAGVVNHAGTMNSGHYITHARATDGNWYEIDDDQVSVSSIGQINSKGPRGWTPYIMAYTKIYEGEDIGEDGESGGEGEAPRATLRAIFTINKEVIDFSHVLQRFDEKTATCDLEFDLETYILLSDGSVMPILDPLKLKPPQVGTPQEGTPTDPTLDISNTGAGNAIAGRKRKSSPDNSGPQAKQLKTVSGGTVEAGYKRLSLRLRLPGRKVT